MNVPSNLKYTKDHEWVKIDGDIVTVGITDFAQGELGDIVYVEVESLEEEPEKVNDDPYGDGWMIKIKVADISDLESLLNADAYKAIIGA